MARPDDLYRTYFVPWYPPERPSPFGQVLPDLEEIELEPGQHIDIVHPLDPPLRDLAKEKVDGMYAAFEQDAQRLLKREDPVGLPWVEAIDAWLTPERCKQLLEQSEPHNFSNPYLVLCCEFGAGIGEVIRSLRPGTQWIHDWPYWDSWIFDLNSKAKCNVFHWVIKRFHEEGAKESLADKVGAAVRFMQEKG